MKIGKISENVLKRSVLKQIKTKREEVLNGAGIGEDCAILLSLESEKIGITAASAAMDGENAVRYAVMRTANALAASAAEPVAVTISALFPENTEEAVLREAVVRAEAECAKLNMQIAWVCSEVTTAVNRPVFTVNGIGKADAEANVSVKNIKPGQDIVVSKWIAIKGTALLAARKEKELLAKYPVRYIEEAKAFDSLMTVIPEAATAVKSGVCAMHSVTEGGIFGALWEVAQGAGVGLEVDLKKLPVRQETIEICEFFEMNPYELVSDGCLIMMAENGYDLVRALEKEGIPAVVVGKTTDTNDRVVINEDETRFLEPYRTDEIYKVL